MPCRSDKTVKETAIYMTPPATAESIKKPKDGKRTSKDENPVELMKVGGDAYAIKLSQLGCKYSSRKYGQSPGKGDEGLISSSTKAVPESAITRGAYC